MLWNLNFTAFPWKICMYTYPQIYVYTVYIYIYIYSTYKQYDAYLFNSMILLFRSILNTIHRICVYTIYIYIYIYTYNTFFRFSSCRSDSVQRNPRRFLRLRGPVVLAGTAILCLSAAGDLRGRGVTFSRPQKNKGSFFLRRFWGGEKYVQLMILMIVNDHTYIRFYPVYIYIYPYDAL